MKLPPEPSARAFQSASALPAPKTPSCKRLPIPPPRQKPAVSAPVPGTSCSRWLGPARLPLGWDQLNVPSPRQQSNLTPACIDSSPLSSAEECVFLEKAILFQLRYQAPILVLSSSGTFSARTFLFWQIVSENWENMMLICLCPGYYEQHTDMEMKTRDKSTNKQDVQQYTVIFVEGTDKSHLLAAQQPRHHLMVRPSSTVLFFPLELVIHFPVSQRCARFMENKMVGQSKCGINGQETGARD